jgi:hypothetical protein
MPSGRPITAPTRKIDRVRHSISRRSAHTISAWPQALQIIMICTARTGSSIRWNSMAPQIAEKAKPATLEISAAANTATMTQAHRSVVDTVVSQAA